MADIDQRLKSLQSKHEELDKKVERKVQTISSDSLESAELKKSKLLIKDEIRRLQDAPKMI